MLVSKRIANIRVLHEGRIVGVERGTREGNIEELQAAAPGGRVGESGDRPGLSPTSWMAPAELTYQQWVRVGQKLGMVDRNAGWWLGDWVQYGAQRYGGRYRIAMRATGYDEQTLMNMVWVARSIEISRRREKLSFSHHAEVAALEVDDQDRLLDRAEEEGLSVRQLRNEVAALRLTSASDGEPENPAQMLETSSEEPPEVGTGDGVATDSSVCPNCGVTL